MLHKIDEDGNTMHICPHCGRKNKHHIEHEQMEWMPSGRLVALPVCEGAACQAVNRRTFVRTHWPEEELAEPLIQRDENDKIINVVIRGAPNLWQIVSHQEMAWRVIDGEEQQVLITVIDAVIRHPAVDTHQQLHQHLYRVQRYPVVHTTEHTHDGMIKWNCPACRAANSVHVSHTGVEHVPHRGTVALPECGCGARFAIELEKPEPLPVQLMIASQSGQPVMTEAVLPEHAQKHRQHQQFLQHLRELGKLKEGGSDESDTNH